MNYDCPFKFRVWDGRAMLMVQTICFSAGGALWYGAGSSFGWAWINPECDEWTKDNPRPTEADVCPVMRWTGLKTEDGTDIWEGDIVEFCFEMIGYRAPDVNLGVVTYNNSRWGYEAIDSIRLAEQGNPVWIPLTDKSIRVIGNVHQHPELLKS